MVTVTSSSKTLGFCASTLSPTIDDTTGSATYVDCTNIGTIASVPQTTPIAMVFGTRYTLSAAHSEDFRITEDGTTTFAQSLYTASTANTLLRSMSGTQSISGNQTLKVQFQDGAGTGTLSLFSNSAAAFNSVGSKFIAAEFIAVCNGGITPPSAGLIPIKVNVTTVKFTFACAIGDAFGNVGTGHNASMFGGFARGNESGATTIITFDNIVTTGIPYSYSRGDTGHGDKTNVTSGATVGATIALIGFTYEGTAIKVT